MRRHFACRDSVVDVSSSRRKGLPHPIGSRREIRSGPEVARGPHGRFAAVALAVALALLPPPAPAPAQQQEGRRDLDETVLLIARAWERGDVGTLTDRMSDEGVLLHLPEAVHPSLSIRMARAALEELHERSGPGEVEVDRVRELGGAPARAGLELLWTPVPPGMSSPMIYTIFMGLQRDADGWWIAEVRILGGGQATSPSTNHPSP